MRDTDDHEKMLAQLLEAHHLRQSAEEVLRQARISHGSTMRFHIDSALNNPPKVSLARLQYGNPENAPPPASDETSGENTGDLITGATPPKSITIKPSPRFGSMTFTSTPFTASVAVAAAGINNGAGSGGGGLRDSLSSSSLCEPGNSLHTTISVSVATGASDLDRTDTSDAAGADSTPVPGVTNGVASSFRTRMLRTSAAAVEGHATAPAGYVAAGTASAARTEGILAAAAQRCRPRRISGADHPAPAPLRRLARTPGAVASTDGGFGSCIPASASASNILFTVPSGGSSGAHNGGGNGGSGGGAHYGREAWQTGTLAGAGPSTGGIIITVPSLHADSFRGSLSPQVRETLNEMSASMGSPSSAAGALHTTGTVAGSKGTAAPVSSLPTSGPKAGAIGDASGGGSGGGGSRCMVRTSVTGSCIEDSESFSVSRSGASYSVARSGGSMALPHNHHNNRHRHQHHQQSPNHQHNHQHTQQQPQELHDQQQQPQQQQQDQQQRQPQRQRRRAFQAPNPHPHPHPHTHALPQESGGALRPTPLALPAQALVYPTHPTGHSSPPPTATTTTAANTTSLSGCPSPVASPSPGGPLSPPMALPSPSASMLEVGAAPGPGPTRAASASFHAGASHHHHQHHAGCSSMSGGFGGGGGGGSFTSQEASSAMALLSRVARVVPKQPPPQEWTVDLNSLEADAVGGGGGGGGSFTSFGSGYSFGVYGQALGRRAGSAAFRGTVGDGGGCGASGNAPQGMGHGPDGDSGPPRRSGSDALAAASGGGGLAAVEHAPDLVGSEAVRAAGCPSPSGGESSTQESGGAADCAAAKDVSPPHALRNLPRQLPALARYRASSGGGCPSARNPVRRSARRSSVGVEEGRPPPSSPTGGALRPRPPGQSMPTSAYGARPGTAVAGSSSHPLSPSLHPHHHQQPHPQQQQHLHTSMDGRQLAPRASTPGEVAREEPCPSSIAGMQGQATSAAAPPPAQSPTLAPPTESAQSKARPRFANLVANDGFKCAPPPAAQGGLASPRGSFVSGNGSSGSGAGVSGVCAGGGAGSGAGGGQSGSEAVQAQGPSEAAGSRRTEISGEEHASIMTRMKKALSFLRRGD